MISIARSKLIRSLERKKSREQHKLFVVEGVKMVRELLAASQENALEVCEIFASGDWIDREGETLVKGIRLHDATEQELRKVSHLHTPQQVLALVRIPESENGSRELWKKSLFLDLKLSGIPGTWGPLSGRPTGLESGISFAPPIRWISIIRRLSSQAWAP